MLRNGASRVARSITQTARPATTFHRTSPSPQWTAQFGSLAARRPQLSQLAQLKPIQAAILRRNLTKDQLKSEDRYQHEKLKVTPETVSSTSSVQPIFADAADTPNQDVDMTAGLKHDVGAIKETFSLKEVPQEAVYMGLAGTLPYLATSLSTVYCAWEINHSSAGTGFLLDHHTATQVLHLLEPLQIGYGAAILSFLGAIHWGLEWAKFGGVQGYRRYAIGVAAPIVACATISLPVEYALISQFLSFVGLYYVDSLACKKGWTPNWYRTYRFLLTFIVGASIVVTLIGRGELPDHIPGAVTRATNLKEGSAEALAEEEEARIAEKKKAAAKDDRGKH